MCNIFRIAKCRQSYTAYCIRRIFRGRIDLRHTMYMSGHRKERSISIFTRKCTGNKKSQSLKHLSTCHQRAMAVQESAVFRTTRAQTLKNKLHKSIIQIIFIFVLKLNYKHWQYIFFAHRKMNLKSALQTFLWKSSAFRRFAMQFLD